jgi:predicted nuclease with TOPRIM domain
MEVETTGGWYPPKQGTREITKDDLADAMNKLSRQNDGLARRVADLQEDNGELRNKLTKAVAEIERLQKVNAEIGAESMLRAARIGRLQEGSAELRERLTHAQEEIVTLRKALKEWGVEL